VPKNIIRELTKAMKRLWKKINNWIFTKPQIAVIDPKLDKPEMIYMDGKAYIDYSIHKRMLQAAIKGNAIS